jgi:DNA-binding NarL/FixJ family response regulator
MYEDRLAPLYPSVPSAARRDARLYELLVLVDAIRAGQAREREIAERELRKTRLSILSTLKLGKSNEEIAGSDLSPSKRCKPVKSLFRKVGVSSRVELLVMKPPVKDEPEP